MIDPKAQLLEAEAAVRAGRLHDAEQLYLSVGEQRGGARQINGLAVLAAKRGQFDEALSLFDRARTLEPENLDAWLNAGNIRRALGNMEATNDFRQALALDPDNLQAHMGLGLCLQKQGDAEGAHKHLSRVTALQPEMPGAAKLAGKLAMQLAKMGVARGHLEAALKLEPDDPELLLLYGKLLHYEGHYVQAAMLLERAVQANPGSETAALLFAGSLADSAQVEKALELCQTAAQKYPESADRFVAHRIKALQVDGRQEQALEEARKACRQWPHSAALWLQLARLDAKGIDDRDVETIRQLMASSSNNDRALLCFSLAAIYESRQELDREIHWLNEGNKARYMSGAFDQDLQKKFGHFMQQKVAAPLPEAPVKSPVSCQPVFIIGMPRSGTTLTEQILSSHSCVAAGGESGLVREALRDWEEQGGLSGLEQMLSERLPEMAAFLRQRLSEQFATLAGGQPWLTEKSVNNYLYVPMIQAAFPEARFVWLRRHPLDNCLGCYKQLFAGGQEFSYNVDDCAAHYGNVQVLMGHWRNTVGIAVHELRYEALVTDLEGSVRQLLDFCGLPFEQACLDFQENRRRVVTASVGQVRQGMFTSAMGRWQRYGDLLDPFRQALERHGVDWRGYPEG